MKLGFAIPHEIRIRASANMGFIVKIGCGEFVAANKGDLFNIGHEFIDDPDKWEKEYNELPGRGEVPSDTPEPLVHVPPTTPPERETDGDNETRG